MEDGAGISTLDAGISKRRKDVIARETKRRPDRRARQDVAKEMHSEDYSRSGDQERHRKQAALKIRVEEPNGQR